MPLGIAAGAGGALGAGFWGGRRWGFSYAFRELFRFGDGVFLGNLFARRGGVCYLGFVGALGALWGLFS
ncbi:hypothetical protein, partial [Helicobacter mehlei]|uniref:hypothetical protein n=1 Tax=Helicobacter mehlei TaxID=2316080 RepID=UPI001F248DF5